MTQTAICELLKPLSAGIVEEIRESFGDFDHIVIPEAQPTVLAARATLTNCRLVHRMSMRFGCDVMNPVRVQELNRVQALVVQGDGFDVGLRLKKYDGSYRVYQHRSLNQDVLRRRGRYQGGAIPGTESPPVMHVFAGYRCTAGVSPRLRDIALSFEEQSVGGEYFVSWHHIIWTPDDGYEPRQTFTPDIFPPDLPNYGIKPNKDGRRKAEGDDS